VEFGIFISEVTSIDQTTNQPRMTQSVEDRINLNFLDSKDQGLARMAIKKGKAILEKYGDYCRAFVCAPNFMAKQDPFEPPSGFSALLDANAPAYAVLFHPKKMGYGTVAVPLNEAVISNRSEPINELHISKNLIDIASRMNVRVPQTTNKPVLIKTHFSDEGSPSDKWEESLGSGGAYAGIYSSVERGTHGYKNRIWLVVQSGNESASEEIYRIIEDCEPDWDVTPSAPAKTTIKTVFNRSDVKFLTKAVIATRERLLCAMAETLDLDSRALFGVSNPQKRLANSIVSTVSYNLTKMGDSHAVYHSATVDPAFCNNGIIMNENPYLGPTILKGPVYPGVQTADIEFGNAWSLAYDDAYGSFPTGTGRVTTFARKNLGDIVPAIPAYDTGKFISEAEGKNLRMSQKIYRTRDSSFKDIEHKLGYNHGWGEIHLKPLVVKVCHDPVPN
jgi:hypothetical protein